MKSVRNTSLQVCVVGINVLFDHVLSFVPGDDMKSVRRKKKIVNGHFSLPFSKTYIYIVFKIVGCPGHKIKLS